MMKISLCLLFLIVMRFLLCQSQVADPVKPHYDHSSFGKFFTHPFLPDGATMEDLKNRHAVGFHSSACLSKADIHHSTHNNVFAYGNISEMPFNFDRNGCGYVPNTTYWFNEDLHVGHVHYDIVLIQVLDSMKIDRIIMQRSICRSNICNGIGAVESFYKGYFAALFEAFDQPNIPVYVRWEHRTKEVKPLFFSAHTTDYYNHELIKNEPLKSITLKSLMCFDTVIRSGKKHTYGSIPTVSARAVQKFKAAAYKMVKSHPPLTTYFERDPPYRILFSFRGPKATRHIENIDELFHALNQAFPPPSYIVRLLNSSEPSLDFQTQLQAVAESHVVIANHGAFEGNMIYMKNSSLLLEIFGNYGNNEIHTFHRLALMFGFYYARLHPQALTDHLAFSYNISSNEIVEVVDTVREYFDRKAFLANVRPNN